MKHRSKQVKRLSGAKVLTRYLNIQPARSLDFVIESTITELDEMMTVESAEVTVERSLSEHPPIRTRIFIETPGPDMEVEARDYTSAAAYNKAWRELQKRAEAKAGRNESKGRASNRSTRPANQKNRH